MILLDENILEDQRLLVEGSGVAVKQIGLNFGRKGMKDDEIIVLLRRYRNITFFTRDADFYRPELRHGRYCLVVMNVGQNESATFVRRFLRHTNFNTQLKRMGLVIRLSHAGLTSWRLSMHTASHTVWDGR